MVTKHIQILLIFCLPITVLSQGIDTLWKDNPTISDSAKLELLGGMCWDLLYSDTAKSRLICDEMLKLTPATANIYARINAYRTGGIIYQELQDFTKTLEYYSRAAELSKNVNDENGRILYGKTLSNFGSFYHKNGDYETALSMYLKADSLLEPFDIYNFKINIYSKISDVYDHLNQEDQYNYYYKKILKLADKAKDTLSLITSDFTYALSAMDKANYNEAEEKLKHALILAIAFQNPESTYICYFNLGIIEQRRKNYSKANDYYKKSLDFAKGEWGDKYDICESLNKLGSLYLVTGNFKEAQKVIELSIPLARDNEFTDILKDALAVAIIIEDTLGNYKKARNYNREYDVLLHKITDLEVRKSISFLDAKYQAEKRENEINKLENKQKLQMIQISRNRLWIIFLLVLTILIVISSIMYFLNFKFKKKIIDQENEINKQKISELEKDNKLLATHAVLQGEEAERTRLARDLHDGLGGLLSGIKLNLTSFKGNFIISGESVDQFDKALFLIDNSITELRRVAHNMMPEVLIKFGLKDALNDFCTQLQVGQNRNIVFQYYGNEKRIDKSIEISIYRIAQELLNNVIKHADASEVIVQLVLDEKRIHLTVQDNGKGFDSTLIDKQKGAGLTNIKARVGSLNGIMEIVSNPGKGTEMSVEFNL